MTQDYKALVDEANIRVDFEDHPDEWLPLIASLADAVEALVAENEKLRAKLDMPCGSCHPCTQWANQTWLNAGLPLPHVSDWEELRAERDALRAQLDGMTEQWADCESGRPDLIASGMEGRERVEDRVFRWNRMPAVLRGEFPRSAVFKRSVGPWVEVTD